MNMAEEPMPDSTVLHVMEIPHGLHESDLSPELDLDTLRAAREAGSACRLSELIPEEARTYRKGEALPVVLQA